MRPSRLPTRPAPTAAPTASPVPRATRPAVAVLLALGLAACGGSGGDPEPSAVRDEGVSPAQTVPTGSGPATAAPAGSEDGPVAEGAADGPGVPLGAGGDGPPADEIAFLPRSDVRGLERLRPYRPDGPWADVLARCALAEELEDACPLGTLPFIAQATEDPSVEDVMERVLVTHDWMGERLEEALRRAPPGLVRLFAPTTSIVVGSTVRPSFYTGRTGGVQLDPEYLWQSVGEKATVSIEEDYRSSFQSLLGFRDASAARVGAAPAFEYFPLDDTAERTFEQAERPLLGLLFHELAHANDFLPPGTAGLVDPTLRPWEALDANAGRWLSPRLQAEYPQASTLLARLADVRYRGEDPTPEEAALDAATVGAEFAGDGATGFYSYLTVQEDFAELFETAMMKAVFDVDVHYAFTSLPADPDDYYCDELLVGWGAMRRLGDPAVALRAGRAVAAIYGESGAIEDFVARESGTATPMTPGVDFCTNLEGGGATMAARSRDGARVRAPIEPMSDAERHALVARRGGTAR